MLSKKQLFFALLVLVFGTFSLAAQEEEKESSTKSEKSEKKSSADSGDDYPYPSFRSEEYKDFVRKRRHDQQDKFMDNKYTHPARPRDKWELGLTGGLLMISGDVKARPGWGVGGTIRKSMGYVFSLRGNFMTGVTTGQNWQPAQGWARSSVDPNFYPNKSLSGGERPNDFVPEGEDRVVDRYDELNAEENDFEHTPNYRGINGEAIWYNYKTKLYDLSISGIFNLHNIRFHKRQTCLDFYVLGGFGGVAYRAMQNQLDENGNEYAELYEAISAERALDPARYSSRRDMLDALKNGLTTTAGVRVDGMDDTYESQAERHFDDLTPFKKYSYKPTAHFGAGIGIRASRLFTIALESRVTYTNDDLLDGQRWQEWGALTRDYDTFIYNGVNLNFNIGRKNSVEPLWWMNPLDYAYQELNEAPCCDDLNLPDFADDDNDGVPNAWDEEPDSREDCPVDTRGRMLDSDRDGVLDCDDHCPHTPPYDIFGRERGEVDEHGCTGPIKIDCNMIDNFCECAKVCPPRIDKIDYNCCDRVFPSILFDLNKFSVRPEFEAQIATVADFLRDPNCHDVVAIIGHTDARAGNDYNNVLSWKRANEVANMLATKYGIPRSRFVVQYRGEDSPAVGGLSDLPTQKNIDADHALNRRVEFKVCPMSNIDMPMPSGPKNAGTRRP